MKRILDRAAEAASSYRAVAGVSCLVLDAEGKLWPPPVGDGEGADQGGTEAAPTGCALCSRLRRCCPEASDAMPCMDLHLHAARQARRFVGTYVYLCPIGFMHWASPLLSSGRHAGVLVGGPVRTIDRDDAIGSIIAACGRGDAADSGAVPAETVPVSAETAAACVDRVPACTSERVQALAQILSALAERASEGGSEEFEASRRRTEQQARISEQVHDIKRRRASGERIAGYPLEKERALLASIRRGDETSSRKILNEMLGIVFFADSPHFELIRFRAVELLVLLSRAAMEAGGDGDGILGANYRYLRRIQDASDQEELAALLSASLERFSRLAFAFRGLKHSTALRKAERYIHDNLSGTPELAGAAAAAGLSPSYFSSVFKQETGEGYSDFVNRLRVEKAAELLTGSDLALSEIALSCGFDEQSWFSKVFKRRMGVSPGRFRDAGGRGFSGAEEIHDRYEGAEARDSS